VQLLPGEQLEQMQPDIQSLLAKTLVEKPHLDELSWLQNFPDKVRR
jgi:hypothetical protein